ncbi:MAG: transposase [Gammaproteobacteria bacterium]|nr:transposase [Gammaproteobacteria bacterium]
MINEISIILLLFRECFSRTASFNWFVVVIIGFILRLDHHGASSIIRWVGLKPSLYTALLSFFRASSWDLKSIRKRWCEIVLSRCPLIMIDDRYIIVGDGIKVSKEAEKMPGVKKLYQDSDNSGKAPYIFGHHFGALGILGGWVKKNFSVFPFAPNSMKA